jgi:hypothetical protein
MSESRHRLLPSGHSAAGPLKPKSGRTAAPPDEAAPRGRRPDHIEQPRTEKSDDDKAKGYDTNAVRRKIEAAGAAPNIPPKSNRVWKNCFSPYLYRSRNAIERMCRCHLLLVMSPDPKLASSTRA